MFGISNQYVAYLFYFLEKLGRFYKKNIMSKLIVNRIKNYLDKTFKDKIDLSDFSKKTDEEQQKIFLSKALAAYSLTIDSRQMFFIIIVIFFVTLF